MLTTTPLSTENPLRDTITKAYRMDEAECLKVLIPEISFPEPALARIAETAKQLVRNAREYKKKQGKIDTLLHQYDLSTDEGIALMCLAEALLRIPDKATQDKLISDKISTAAWKNHLSTDNSFFVNAATWSLLLTGKIYAPTLDHDKSLFSALKRSASQLGVAMIRVVIFQMMKAIGKQFVIGENIHLALKNALPLEKMGYLFSYDMLGEAARSAQDAEHYFNAYMDAIVAASRVANSSNLAANPSISIKLSALHPTYEYTKHRELLNELPQRVLALLQQAKQHDIGVVIDAEEAERLDISLDIFEKVFTDPSIASWEGFGLAIQAYQKRTWYLLDWLADLSKRHKKRIIVRLIKGAYWDAEIKMAQVKGLSGYPVFTRKNATDVSYLACARKMLKNTDRFYAQFGTHNAYSVAAIIEMLKDYGIPKGVYEFQCLYGMGRPLYDQLVDKFTCRMYAPVGTHKDLLGYLVRRLLENGANSSFLNQLADEQTPLEKIVIDPVARIDSLANKSHPRIPLPKDIYGYWQNSQGFDLSDPSQVETLKKGMEAAVKENWQAGSIIAGKALLNNNAQPVTSPSFKDLVIGKVTSASEDDVSQAVATAYAARSEWEDTPYEKRAALLEQAADLFQEAMPSFMAMLTREGGRCILDCMSEVREAIDYCRYYAYRARCDLPPVALPGPTGEANQLSLHPRGVIACISPWNFPLAIFTGQIVAALVTGNPVIAKPAEQTPLIAFKAVELLHKAGIPKNALQLLIGDGETVGAKLVSDPRVSGVMFTGSTETAKIIELALANRPGPIALFIAETGGQNAMIVDSSALPEQTIIDIAQSAFNSAGQRCSALRVLFVQEELAPKLIDMLKGYMAELLVGDPSLLETDIGPVIDTSALQMLKKHFAKMDREAKFIAQTPLPESLTGHYFAPCAFEINDISILEREVFGPILHVIRYQARDLNKVMDAIITTGYGLTLGIESRINATIDYIANRMPVGNIYVNRNMIGAVVGVQPFGGERLSGTGPKAGGPHYLPRLCIERALSTNTVAVGGNARLVSLFEED